MDAKVGDWVVTPRRGKAVEINALWYNALRLMENWVREEIGEAEAAKYANARTACLRVFQPAVLVRQPAGISTTSSTEKAATDSSCVRINCSRFRSRTRFSSRPGGSRSSTSYNNTCSHPTACAALPPAIRTTNPSTTATCVRATPHITRGPSGRGSSGRFIDAWLRVYPDDSRVRASFCVAFQPTSETRVSARSAKYSTLTIPFMPRGCVAQAWSVAEVLRCWLKTSH